jgi:hypothetical protein
MPILQKYSESFKTPHAHSTEYIIVIKSAEKNLKNWMISKPFRHCFVIIRKKHHWRMIDPSEDKIFTCTLLNHDPFSLRDDMNRLFTRSAYGKTEQRVRGTMEIGTCVGVLKTVLGIRNWRVQTPMQLYDHLSDTYLESSD